VPYSLGLSALRRIPRRAFGVLLSLEPGIAAFAGWLLLSQRISVASLIAIGVVVAASVGSTVTAREQEVRSSVRSATAGLAVAERSSFKA
jgi:inner membrane transporter RhtA